MGEGFTVYPEPSQQAAFSVRSLYVFLEKFSWPRVWLEGFGLRSNGIWLKGSEVDAGCTNMAAEAA